MTKIHIAADATIADLMSSLSEPEDYLIRVLRTFYTMKKSYGEVTVRIGITSQGKSPHYRIDDAESGKPLQAFDFLGEPFPDYRAADTKNWSAKSMTFKEVQSLLGDLRSMKRRGQHTSR